MMNKIKYLFFATLALALMALPALAQAGAGAADNDSTVLSAKAIGGGIGFGLAAGLAGIGQGLVGSRSAYCSARNPGAAGTFHTLMIIAIALIWFFHQLAAQTVNRLALLVHDVVVFKQVFASFEVATFN